MIKVKCPKCAKTLGIEDSKAGMVAACPCGQKFKVPAANGVATKPTTGAAKPPAKPTAAVRTQSPAAKGPLKSSPTKVTAAKAIAKTPAKPGTPATKPNYPEDDFTPYGLQPAAEPPPPQKTYFQTDDEEDEQATGKRPTKKKGKGQSSGLSDADRGKREIIIIACILVIIKLLSFLPYVLPKENDEQVMQQFGKAVPAEKAKEMQERIQNQHKRGLMTSIVRLVLLLGLLASLISGQSWARLTLAGLLVLGVIADIFAISIIAIVIRVVGMEGFWFPIILAGTVVCINAIIAIRLMMSPAIKCYCEGA